MYQQNETVMTSRPSNNNQINRGDRKGRTESNTMLAGDSVSTNNSPYYIQAFEQGAVLNIGTKGGVKRKIITQQKMSSHRPSTVAMSMSFRDGMQTGSLQSKIFNMHGKQALQQTQMIMSPPEGSYRADISRIDTKSWDRHETGAVPTQLGHLQQYYEPKTQIQSQKKYKVARDLWSKVQQRRVNREVEAERQVSLNEKIKQGSLRMAKKGNSLNLETRGLLALNKKEQQKFDKYETQQQDLLREQKQSRNSNHSQTRPNDSLFHTPVNQQAKQTKLINYSQKHNVLFQKRDASPGGIGLELQIVDHQNNFDANQSQIGVKIITGENSQNVQSPPIYWQNKANFQLPNNGNASHNNIDQGYHRELDPTMSVSNTQNIQQSLLMKPILSSEPNIPRQPIPKSQQSLSNTNNANNNDDYEMHDGKQHSLNESTEHDSPTQNINTDIRRSIVPSNGNASFVSKKQDCNQIDQINIAENQEQLLSEQQVLSQESPTLIVSPTIVDSKLPDKEKKEPTVTKKQTVHDRLSQSKQKCSIKCPFLQEEKVTLSEANHRKQQDLLKLNRKSKFRQRRNLDHSGYFFSEIPQGITRINFKKPSLHHNSLYGNDTFSKTYLLNQLDKTPKQLADKRGQFNIIKANKRIDRQVYSTMSDQFQNGEGRARHHTETSFMSNKQGREHQEISHIFQTSTEKYLNMIQGSQKTADHAIHQQIMNMLEQSRDVSILKDGQHRIYPLNLNQKPLSTQSPPLFKPIAGAREPKQQYLGQNRHTNAHMDIDCTILSESQSGKMAPREQIVPKNQEKVLEPNIINERPLSMLKSNQQLSQVIESREETIGSDLENMLENYQNQRKNVRTVDATAGTRRPLRVPQIPFTFNEQKYRNQELSNEALRGQAQKERSLNVSPNQSIGPLLQNVNNDLKNEVTAMNVQRDLIEINKPKTRQEGKRAKIPGLFNAFNSQIHQSDLNQQIETLNDQQKMFLQNQMSQSYKNQRFQSLYSSQRSQTIPQKKEDMQHSSQIQNSTNKAVMQSMLTSQVDTASRSDKSKARAKSQIMQSHIYNKTMISNLNNITSKFLKEQIIDQIVLNQYASYLSDQPYMAQDEAKHFKLQPEVYGYVDATQAPHSNKWFPEQSDADRVSQRGHIKEKMTHFRSKDPSEMIQEQLIYNLKRQEFNQFKQKYKQSTKTNKQAMNLPKSSFSSSIAHQLQKLQNPLSSSPTLIPAAFKSPPSYYAFKNQELLKDQIQKAQNPVTDEAHVARSNIPPPIVDTQTKCEYNPTPEQKKQDKKREYQAVVQRVSERAKVKVYMQRDLVKEGLKKGDVTQKMHDNIKKQMQSNSYQKQIYLKQFVEPEKLDFGITTTRLENEQIIPNSQLHLDFYPQKQSKQIELTKDCIPEARNDADAAYIETQQIDEKLQSEISDKLQLIIKQIKARQKLKESDDTVGAETQIKQDQGTITQDQEGEAQLTPRIQTLLQSLLFLSYSQAKNEKDKIEGEKKRIRDFNNLYYYQQYMAKNELGNDIFRTQQREFNKLLHDFQTPDDWFNEILMVRKYKMLMPSTDLDGDGIPDEEQDVKDINYGVQGQLLNGVFYTQAQLQEKMNQREIEYFNLLEVAERINKGLPRNLVKHGPRQRLAKMLSIDDVSKLMSVKEMLAMIKPVPTKKHFEK